MDAGDPNHRAAASLWQRLMGGVHGRLVTSDYVMAETYNLLQRREGAEPVKALSRLLKETRSVELLWVGPDDHEHGLALLLNRRDKRWSFTDCTSFVVMEALGIRDVFAFDKDFAQAGFSVYP